MTAHGAQGGRAANRTFDGMTRLEHDVVTLPADQVALGLVEAILGETMFPDGGIAMSHSGLVARLAVIQGDAERLKVLLEKGNEAAS